MLGSSQPQEVEEGGEELLDGGQESAADGVHVLATVKGMAASQKVSVMSSICLIGAEW